MTDSRITKTLASILVVALTLSSSGGNGYTQAVETAIRAAPSVNMAGMLSTANQGITLSPWGTFGAPMIQGGLALPRGLNAFAPGLAETRQFSLQALQPQERAVLRQKLILIKNLERYIRNRPAPRSREERVRLDAIVSDMNRLMIAPGATPEQQQVLAQYAAAAMDGRAYLSPVLAEQAEATPVLAVQGSAAATAAAAPLSKRPIGFLETSRPVKYPKGIATTLLISPNSFELTDNPGLGLTPEEEAQLRTIRDPAERERFMLTHSRLESMFLTMPLYDDGGKPTEEQKQEWIKKAPALMREHLMETLARYDHAKIEENGVETYHIPRGLEFWADFAAPADPEKRMAARIFLHNVVRTMFNKDYAYGLVSSLTESFKAITRLIESDRMTPAELEAITTLAEKQDNRFSRYGRYALLGRGIAFHLANDVFIEAVTIQDPVLLARMDRVLRFMAHHNIHIEHDDLQGAAAFFEGAGSRMVYVMPSRADANSTAHEDTHGRWFVGFEPTLTALLVKRMMGLPYEDDGPPVGLGIGFGGFFNLLNELNSWRTGESFDGGKSDADILQILHDSYGPQAGIEAATLFAQLWPAARVAGISVPRLILNSIRSLNRRTPGGLALLGRRAVADKDEIGQRDFLRLLWARYLGKEAPQYLLEVAQTVAEKGSSEEMKKTAQMTLAALKQSAAGPHTREDVQRGNVFMEYNHKATDWVLSLRSDKIKVIPFDVSFSYPAAMYFAFENKIMDYEALIQAMRQRFGADQVGHSEEGKALFAKVVSKPGDSFDARLKAYLEEFNAAGFETLWPEFINNPDYEIRNLLAAHHKDDFKAEHLTQLVRWALGDPTDPRQKTAAKLFEGLFDAYNFGVIFPDEELKHQQDQQRAFNKANGKDADANLPSNRAPNPGHPLFDPEVDKALAQYMFDGKPGSHRIDMINLLTQRTYPEELPLLNRRLLSVIADHSASGYDLWVARMFLEQPNPILLKPHIRWERSVARAVMSDPAPNLTALEFVGEFYRLTTDNLLNGPQWGRYGGLNLDAKARAEAQKAIAQLPPEPAAFYQQAMNDLWKLLSHDNRKVRTAALYAIAAHPELILGLEEKMISELGQASSPYRRALFQLIGMMSPGFSPGLDELIGRLQPNKIEQAYLDLRRKPTEAIRQDVQPQIKSTTANPLIQRYLANEFQPDFNVAISFARAATGMPAGDFNVPIEVRDAKSQNGVTADLNGQISIAISSISNPAVYKPGEFKASVFHELGHVVLKKILAEHSRAWKEIEAIRKDSSGAAFYRTYQLNESFDGIKEPYAEFLADVFAVIFSKQSGMGADGHERDFAKLQENMDSFTGADAPTWKSPAGKDPHTALNPLRAWLWNSYLETRINDNHASLALYKILLEAAAAEIDRRYEEMKQKIADGQKMEFTSVPDINRGLKKAIDSRIQAKNSV